MIVLTETRKRRVKYVASHHYDQENAKLTSVDNITVIYPDS